MSENQEHKSEPTLSTARMDMLSDMFGDMPAGFHDVTAAVAEGAHTSSGKSPKANTMKEWILSAAMMISPFIAGQPEQDKTLTPPAKANTTIVVK